MQTRLLVWLTTAVALLPVCVTAQVREVDGTGNPAVDVPAVQTAVNDGGTVMLRGTFDFTGAESGNPLRIVTVRDGVRITGMADANGRLPTIVGGQRAFLVAAPGADVSFENLRFEGSDLFAIAVSAAHNLSVIHCTITGLTPIFFAATGEILSGGIFIQGGPFNDIRVVGNAIDATATANDSSNGIFVIGATASVVVADNTITNTTAHGLDLRNVAGVASVTGNQLLTGQVGRLGTPGRYADGIRCVGSGSYTVDHNVVRDGFENGAGIRLGGTKDAVVHANTVDMATADGAVFGNQSAAIVVEGSASGTEVRNSAIRGRARVALSVIHSDFPLDKGAGTGDASNTMVLGNNLDTFEAARVDIEIGVGAVNTEIVGGNGTIDDHGTGTTVTSGFSQ